MQVHELIGHTIERKYLASVLICENAGMILGFLIMALLAAFEEKILDLIVG